MTHKFSELRAQMSDEARIESKALADAIIANLDNPPAPNEKLRELAERYSVEVESRD